MNRKYTYVWTPREDFNIPGNNYGETEHITVIPPYDFMDWLNDSGAQAEQDGNTYYILDIGGDRTGEAYLIISVENTDENLIN